MTVALLRILVSAVALGLWRRWLGGWGGDDPRWCKCIVLAVLTDLACAPLTALLWPVAFLLLVLWFLVGSNNGGGDHPLLRYGPAGLGYWLAKRRAAAIPSIPWLGVSAGGWTEVGELWLGATTGAALAALAHGLGPFNEIISLWGMP